MGVAISSDMIGDHLERLRERRPLVHNITNFVVMNWTAKSTATFFTFFSKR